MAGEEEQQIVMDTPSSPVMKTEAEKKSTPRAELGFDGTEAPVTPPPCAPPVSPPEEPLTPPLEPPSITSPNTPPEATSPNTPAEAPLTPETEPPLDPPSLTPPKDTQRKRAKRTTLSKETERTLTLQPGSVDFLKAKYAHMIPGRPLNAYFLFLKDQEQRHKAEDAVRAEGKHPSVAAIGTKLGEMWQALETEAKTVFTTQVALAASEYAVKSERWKATPEFAELEMAKRQEKKSKKRPLVEASESVSAINNANEPSASPAQITPTKKRAIRPPRKITALDIDAIVLKEATELSLDGQLIALACSAEVQALGINACVSTGAKVLLHALQRLGPAEGSVEAARDAILFAGSNVN